MTANPLKIVERQRPKRSPHEDAARMNAYTKGQIPGHKDKFIEYPRNDVHWVVRDNRCVIEWVAPPKGQMGK